MFLKEREKIFSSKLIQEQMKSPSTPTENDQLVIDETAENVAENENESSNVVLDSAMNTTTLSKELVNEKPLPEPYVLPSLPDPVVNAMQSKQMEKFEKMCYFRSIVIDAVFYDLKHNYNLLCVVFLFML